MADAIKYGEWEVGFFECFHDLVPNCCMAWCLPCVSIAQISSRIGTHRFATALLFTILLNIVMSAIFFVDLFAPVDEEDGYDYDDRKLTQLSTLKYVTGSISVAAFLVYSVLVSDLRNNVRTRFNIPGNSCVDCLMACCCSCCTIAQMATHVKSYKPGSCEFGPPDTLQGFPTK
ncbi:hypothetical protein Poli38472_009547 [Pythium oligandrum]|uniref:PLAC8 family protein n=1 Tax=Pythium oligandrum TaxID=41045 RepID=A0A8K1FIG4_PYTOL|nr:hypothetical protein Poli38472_009547 [Pythium oligandrum]|eukprot:TMW62054.1 hypothetical protein Poli38472_009547 [Pythium oligandrum]